MRKKSFLSEIFSALATEIHHFSLNFLFCAFMRKKKLYAHFGGKINSEKKTLKLKFISHLAIMKNATQFVNVPPSQKVIPRNLPNSIMNKFPIIIFSADRDRQNKLKID